MARRSKANKYSTKREYYLTDVMEAMDMPRTTFYRYLKDQRTSTDEIRAMPFKSLVRWIEQNRRKNQTTETDRSG